MAKHPPAKPDPPADDPAPAKRIPTPIEADAHGDFHENRGEVREFFDKAKDLSGKYGNAVFGVLAIAALLYAAFTFYGYIQQQRLVDATEALDAAGVDPAAYLAVADEHGMVANRAKLRAADLWLQQANQPVSAEFTAEQKATALNNAGNTFQTVIDSDAPAIYTLNARLGLASVLENQSDWNGAKQQYQAVIEQGNAEHYPALAGLAQARLALVDAIANPLPFAPEPVATQPAATQPTATAPATQPSP
ncbi:MAG: hypothetical protein AAF750_14680 [Planctomycetota bacterium]